MSYNSSRFLNIKQSTGDRSVNHKDITLLFVYGSSDINILHLPFLRSGKDPLEDLIYTSCTDPIQQPAAARTPRLYTALGCVNHLFYASVRKATNTEFNLFVLGRDLIFGFEIHSLYDFAQLSRM
ncbi:hypothetical protein F511_31270 [Dorcoceras hygrometricum]|uniref:Uncharacterized protein n=1 Tax=Dorcoceras hygrometricum TaxID=472368 RepID=A0A2Z7DEM9_9LAMI|nr:hypothetical protein F511_31270 [Dorcoceras hygrometricum]